MTRVRTRLRRPRLVLAGLVALALGVGLLGYVGWQLVGTNVVAKHRQQEVTDAVERVWRDPGTASAEDRDHATDVVALVRVPAFGEGFVVPAYAGASDDVLARGLGVLDGSTTPGGDGNLALTGHRITHGEPFRNLPDLEPGDRVLVETETTVYTYVMDTAGDDITVTADADWVAEPRPVNPDEGSFSPTDSRLITLVTCAELFHTDDRLVAFGHLEDTSPR